MSRYYEDDGDDEYQALAWGRWERNSRAVLKSKRGRKALTDLRDALLALPEKRLIEGSLCTVNPAKRFGFRPQEGWTLAKLLEDLDAEGGEGVCAVGALLWHRKVKAGMDPAEAFDSLPTLPDTDSSLSATADLAVSEAGIAYTLAWELAYRNDETYRGKSPEERYTAFLGWVEGELAESAS